VVLQLALSGTSFSAPLVTGAVALLQAQQRQLGLRGSIPMSVMLRLFEPPMTSARRIRDSMASWAAAPECGARARRDMAIPRGALGGRLVGSAGGVPHRERRHAESAMACDNRSLVMLDGVTLDTLWSASLPFVSPIASPAIGAIAGRRMGIFVALASGGVAGYRDDGTPLPLWPRQGTDSAHERGGTGCGTSMATVRRRSSPGARRNGRLGLARECGVRSRAFRFRSSSMAGIRSDRGLSRSRRRYRRSRPTTAR
jgi:hypothetical protein